MKKIESGRSMIEMLGVLAIIGVLSIGGLAAYNTAMDRHAANELLNDASTCLIMAETDATSLTACYKTGTTDGILGSRTTPSTGCTLTYSSADHTVTLDDCTDTDVSTAFTERNGSATVK